MLATAQRVKSKELRYITRSSSRRDGRTCRRDRKQEQVTEPNQTHANINVTHQILNNGTDSASTNANEGMGRKTDVRS